MSRSVPFATFKRKRREVQVHDADVTRPVRAGKVWLVKLTNGLFNEWTAQPAGTDLGAIVAEQPAPPPPPKRRKSTRGRKGSPAPPPPPAPAPPKFFIKPNTKTTFDRYRLVEAAGTTPSIAFSYDMGTRSVAVEGVVQKQMYMAPPDMADGDIRRAAKRVARVGKGKGKGKGTSAAEVFARAKAKTDAKKAAAQRGRGVPNAANAALRYMREIRARSRRRAGARKGRFLVRDLDEVEEMEAALLESAELKRAEQVRRKAGFNAHMAREDSTMAKGIRGARDKGRAKAARRRQDRTKKRRAAGAGLRDDQELAGGGGGAGAGFEGRGAEKKSEAEMRKLLFQLFQKSELLTMKDVMGNADFAVEPQASVKAALKKICVYHKKGEHAKHYELKPEFGGSRR